MKIVLLLLVILILALLMVKMPPPVASPSTRPEPVGAEIESVADIAMLSGACGMRPPQLE